VNDAKDRGVCPNPEREGQDGDESETGSFPELAKREAKIIHGVVR
jgi:hypothetical protein